MTLVVLSALDSEIRTLVDTIEDLSSNAIGAWPTWSGSIGDKHVILAKAGLGKSNTAALAGVLWERHRPSTMIFTGVAGGLDPSLHVGDIVIGERSIQHDWGVVGANGLERYQSGHIPFFNPTDHFGYTPSRELLDLALSVGNTVHLDAVLGRAPRVSSGTILTGDQFLQDPSTRDRLFTELNAQAIEMEGAALGQVAVALGFDHLVIRSLSDLAGEESIEHFDEFVPQVAANSAKVVLALLPHI